MASYLQEYPFLSDFLLGGFSGSLSKTITAPLERMKLLLQTQNSNPQLKHRPYKGMMNCYKRIFYEEGVHAFWRGNTVSVALSFPSFSFNFAFRGLYTYLLNPSAPELSRREFMGRSILAGGLAGVSGQILVYPLEVVKTRLSVDNAVRSQFNGAFGCARAIFMADGLQGLYNGLGVSIPSAFIFRGLHFGLFDIAKGSCTDYQQRHLLFKFLVAQVVSTTSELVTYPFDTIRRTLMMNSAALGKQRFGVLRCVKRIYRISGVKGFFKGNVSNMMRSLSSSLVLVFYDEMKGFLQRSK